MASMFGQGKKAEDIQSEAGDDVGDSSRGLTGGAPSGLASGSGGVFREDAQARVLKGRGTVAVDKRKFRYDVVRGRGAALPFAVTRDDRMDASEAGEMLHSIHIMCGVDRETEDVLQAFDSGLFFCHTVNGGSVLNPGRSKFHVRVQKDGVDGDDKDGMVTEEFDYAKIRDKLGQSMRRFFRAYADETMEVNKRVLRDYDPYNPYSHEQWGWLMEVAHDRGMMRYPYLSHDSADACLGLNAVERQALRASKALVVGGTPNSADRMKPSGGIASANRFDSSVGESYVE